MTDRVGQPRALLAHDGITGQNPRRSRKERTQNRKHDAVIQTVKDTAVAQDARLAVGDIRRTFAGPEHRAKIAPGIIARLHDKRFHRKSYQRHDGNTHQK